MAKKKRKHHSLPKRIAGVKLPKGLRRYADTPLGGALIGVTLVELGREVLLSPAISGYVGDIRQQFGKAGLALAGGLQHLAAGDDADASQRKSRRRTTSRLEQEKLAH